MRFPDAATTRLDHDIVEMVPWRVLKSGGSERKPYFMEPNYRL